MTRGFKGLKGLGRAFALALLACCALSAFSAANASALEWKNTAGRPFTMVGGSQTFYTTSSGNWVCGEAGGVGTGLNGTEIEVTFSFKNCRAFGFTCTTAGQEKGTILFQSLRAKLVYTNKAHTKFGWLFHPEGGSSPIAEASCFGQILRVRGSWISEITQPGLNGTSSSFTISSRSTGVVQEPQQIEEEGLHYHLESSQNGGAYSEMALVGSATGFLASGEGTFVP